MSYTVAIAGTTKHTLMCAQAISQHPQLTIPFAITPAPKAIGRAQKITKNSVQVFADSNHIPSVLIKNKIDEKVKEEISAFEKPDFLLVVDFGYWVPKWLISLPKIMPLNIHPSALPKWRGSSPGQFVLLGGDRESAVTLIEMTLEFDQGPIAWQKQFVVDQSWTQTEYYRHSFELVCAKLPVIILQLAKKEITLAPQPTTSPTPLAHKLTKQDSFVEWEAIQQAMIKGTQAQDLERASRAYSPWPLLWTMIPTIKGEKRMQLIKCSLGAQKKLILEVVKIEGLGEKPWAEVKNIVSN